MVTPLLPPTLPAHAAEAFVRATLERQEQKQQQQQQPPSPAVEQSIAAYKRIRAEHTKLFRHDWLPLIRGVKEITNKVQQFLAETARETNTYAFDLHGKPEYASPLFQLVWKEYAESLPWFQWLQDRSRKNLLQAIRELGEEETDFLEWYGKLDEYQREQWLHPVTLWRHFKAHTNEPNVVDPQKAVVSSDAEQLADLIVKHEQVVGERDNLIVARDKALSFLQSFSKLLKEGKVKGLPPAMRKTLDELVSP
jgi:hypothetical protein